MERAIPIESRDELSRLFGPYDRNLKEIKKTAGVEVIVRDGEIRVRGTRGAVDKAVDAFLRLKGVAAPTPEDVHVLLDKKPTSLKGHLAKPVPGNIFRGGLSVTDLRALGGPEVAHRDSFRVKASATPTRVSAAP